MVIAHPPQDQWLFAREKDSESTGKSANNAGGWTLSLSLSFGNFVLVHVAESEYRNMECHVYI